MTNAISWTEAWTKAATDGEAVWLGDVRAVCAKLPDAHRVILRLTLCDGSVRDYVHFIPPWETEPQRRLAKETLCAGVFNVLSALSGQALCLYADTENSALMALLGELDAVFQLSEPRRRGYGKAISVAKRLNRSFGLGRFTLSVEDIRGYLPLPEQNPAPTGRDLAKALREAVQRAEGLCCCGIDVGGTDIKLAVSRAGQLVYVSDYDWDPSAFSVAEELIEPILRLARQGAEQAGAPFDAIGLSFPDVVIRNRIVGGETPKTKGMRENPATDYEQDFARLSVLGERLMCCCRPGAPVRLINDGSMAAFTAAVELASDGQDTALAGGLLAHSLGTDLGTGWLLADGRVPELPLELYDLLLDLGSWPQRAYAPEDLRSVCNENSGLPGARRYLGQAAAYRLAQELNSALLEGFTENEGGVLRIRRAPDLRKPCLAQLQAQAEAGQAEAEEIFRRIGGHLAQVNRELRYLLRPETDTRFLFGRFVRQPRCFALMQEGCARVLPDLTLVTADETLAKSPLMRQLARRGAGGVAAFGQAVGSIYYALMEDCHETK